MTANRAHEHGREPERPDRLDRRPESGPGGHPLLALQRSAGNRGVGALLRTQAIEPVTPGLVQRFLEGQKAENARRAALGGNYRYDHIYERHGSASKAEGAGKFADNKMIPRWIRAAIDSGTIDETGSGWKFEHRFDDPIGININGRPAYRIRVIVTKPKGKGASPFLNTAFPF